MNLYKKPRVSHFIDEEGNRGIDGRNGINGQTPFRGQNGQHGNIGQIGENGQHGYNGTDATQGEHGSNGYKSNDINVFVYGSPSNLIIKINQTNERIFSLKEGEIISIRSIGGRGGNGGNAGKPGNGSDGGNGGDGGNGEIKNDFITKPGNGGNGGNGGNAGRPANGGNGGNGGDAGNVIITTNDPSLLALVNGYSIGGDPGIAGEGSPQSSGGQGGRPGKGGILKENRGIDGKIGNAGFYSSVGVRGYDGEKGKDGCVIYQVINQENIIIEKSSKIYEPIIKDFIYQPVLDDGIYEPGEEVIISDILLENKGGLTLPSSNLTFYLDENPIFTLKTPFLEPQKAFLFKDKISINLPNINFKNEEIYQGKTNISTCLDVHSIQFKNSILEKTIMMKYPIKISKVFCPEQLGHADSKLISIFIKNISKIKYEKQIKLKIKLIGDLYFLNQEENEKTLEILSINSNNTLNIEETILMGYDSKFYENSYILFELYLRDQLIQNKKQLIQCVPRFSKDSIKETDVLLITNKFLSHEQFNTISTIFKALQLKINYWDSDFYNGISYDLHTNEPRDDLSKNLRDKTIIFSSNYKDFEKMSSKDIHNHFLGDKDEELNSGILIIGCKETNSIISHCFRDSKLIKELPTEEFSDSFRFSNPTIQDMNEKCIEIQKDISSKDLLYKYKIKGEFKPFKVGNMSWSLSWNYCYGKGCVYKIPFDVTHNFIAIQDKIYEKKWSNKINLNDGLFRLIFGIIMSLPIQKKLELLSMNLNLDWIFVDQKEITIVEVIKMAVYCELKRNYKFTGLNKFKKVLSMIQENIKYLSENTISIIAFTLLQIKKEETPFKWNPFGDLSKVKEIDEFLLLFQGEINNLAIKIDLYSYVYTTLIENSKEDIYFDLENIYKFILD